jgi:alkylhydroperoxidase family enzyme
LENPSIRQCSNPLLYGGISGEVNMARIPLLEPDMAPPEVKAIYDGVLKGKPHNVQKAMAHRPEVLKNFLPFYGSVGRSLDRKLYEQIYIRVSWLNGCNY